VELNAANWEPRRGGRIRYLDIAAISRTGTIGELRDIDAKLAPSRARRIARSGDVVVSTVRPHLRAFARVRSAPDNLVVSTGFAVLTPKRLSDSEFVYQQVLTDEFISFLDPRTTGTGYPAVRGDDVVAFPIALPAPLERERIGCFLRSIDLAIEKTEAVIEATETLRKALLQELLTRGVPDWHTEWKTVPGIGTIPACWEVGRLGEVAEVQTGRQVGKAPRGPSVSVPYLSVANVKDGYLHLETVKAMAVSPAEVARFSLRAGDVLFTEGGDRDKLGRGCVWTGEIHPCVHQNHVFAVRPHLHRLSAWYLSIYAGSAAGKAYFMGCAKQTTNLASINSTQLRDLPVPLPTVFEQEKAQALVGTVDARLTQELQLLMHLRDIKRETASALLSGRLRVPFEDGGVAR